MTQIQRIHALMKVHTVPSDVERNTWLQLFFDLVQVAILVELGNQLANDLSLQGLATFIFVFIPV